MRWPSIHQKITDILMFTLNSLYGNNHNDKIHTWVDIASSCYLLVFLSFPFKVTGIWSYHLNILEISTKFFPFMPMQVDRQNWEKAEFQTREFMQLCVHNITHRITLHRALSHKWGKIRAQRVTKLRIQMKGVERQL